MLIETNSGWRSVGRNLAGYTTTAVVVFAGDAARWATMAERDPAGLKAEMVQLAARFPSNRVPSLEEEQKNVVS